MPSSVFIIVPVYNRCAVTLACLSHLQQTGVFAQCELVIVDDGSTDGTAEAIRANYPDVTVLTGDGNLWWTGAMRLGMAYTWEQNATIVVWLNDDCLPEPGAIATLIEFVHHQPRTIATAACYLPDSELPLETGFRGRRRLTAHPGEVMQVEGTSGYCVAIPRSVMAAIGFPDADRFPHYGGDGMYLLQATRAGFRVCILGDARVRLPGITDTIHCFADYVQQLSAPTWQDVFWSKKSPYHLPTRFYYCRAKHGMVWGGALFLMQSLGQTVSWLAHWFR
jgi:GT2 family glycosyltransferase